MWLIAGLGNPGKKYMYTWHNMGYLAVDLLAERNGFFLDKDKFSGMYGKGKIKGEDAIIIKPTTFMNNSGECIVPAAKFFKIEPDHIIVVYDDINVFLFVERIYHVFGDDCSGTGCRRVLPDAAAVRVEAGVGQRGGDPVAALADGRVRQADDDRLRVAGAREVRLDGNGDGLDPAESA